MSTFERFANILTGKFSVVPGVITPEAKLEDLGLDSLDLIEVIFEVEETFEIRIPQDGGSALKTVTVQDIVTSIDELIAAEGPESA
jgi:acyl carrier protein